MTPEQVRAQYTAAGRAVHAWLTEFPPEVPENLRGTSSARVFLRARQSAAEAYRASRAVWDSGRPTRDLGKQTRAANMMAQTARTLQRVTRTLSAYEGLSGSALREWRGWWRSPTIEVAIRGFTRWMGVLDRAMGVLPEAAAAAGAGAAWMTLGLGLVGLGVAYAVLR